MEKKGTARFFTRIPLTVKYKKNQYIKYGRNNIQKNQISPKKEVKPKILMQTKGDGMQRKKKYWFEIPFIAEQKCKKRGTKEVR